VPKKSKSNLKAILFDFDGVILDSMDVRDSGFRYIFRCFDDDKLEELILYHRKNGGLSRFKKINYFYKEILKKEISSELVNSYAEKYSTIMRKELVNKDKLIGDTIDFIKSSQDLFDFHIVSGSEHTELNYLCTALKIDKYFLSISGSPAPKEELITRTLERYMYKKNEAIVVGDSINDLVAAKRNGLTFIGYNNESIRSVCKNYIESFMDYKGRIQASHLD
jgi:HAD superfamily hydrolase (TIGR01549 family)